MISNPTTGDAKLYVRGTDESMRKLIHLGKGVTHYENAINFNKVNGFKSIVFGSKAILKQRAEEFRQEFLSIMKTMLDQDLRLHKLAKSLETDLDFEGIVGFDNSLNTGAEEALDLYKKMGVRTHIVSGDNLEHCLMAAQTLNLIGNAKDSGYHHLEFLNENIGGAQLKRILEIINKSVFRLDLNLKKVKLSLPKRKEDYCENSMKNLNIVINGSTLETICKSKYLLEHFKFILEFTMTVVGYEFTPTNKAQLVNLFKDLNRVTAAFGDGYNDFPMLKSANVGIQVRSRLIPIKFGDIIVDNLLPLVQLCSLECRNWNQNLHVLVKLMIRLSLICFVIELLYQTTIEFTSSSIFISQLHIFGQICALPAIIFYLYHEKSASCKSRRIIPSLYIEKNYITKELPIKSVLFGLVFLCLQSYHLA